MGPVYNPDEKPGAKDGLSGASAKRQFFASASDSASESVFAAAIECVRPEGLHDIMQEICDPFTRYYAAMPKQPLMRNRHRPDEMAKYISETKDHNDKVTCAFTSCTHAYMLKAFNGALDSSRSPWLEGDGAQDQYPPHIRKAHAQGKDVDGFYRMTDAGGVSISRPSEVARAQVAIPLGPLPALDNDLRFYSRGSGRSSGYSRGSGRSGGYIEAASEAASEGEEEPPRKKQRT